MAIVMVTQIYSGTLHIECSSIVCQPESWSSDISRVQANKNGSIADLGNKGSLS